MWLLHVAVEVRAGAGVWRSSHEWVAEGPYIRPASPLYAPDIAGTPASLQGVFSPDLPLARELARLPVVRPRPADADSLSLAYLERFEKGEYQCGCVPMSALRTYEWHKPVRRFYRVTKEAHQWWRDHSVVPVWAFTAPEDQRTEEIYETISPQELWGDMWLRTAVSQFKVLPCDARLLYTLQKESL